MAQDANPIEVYLEIGQSRTFAAALHWPGWCRSGRDEDAALEALYEYGSRYARILQSTPFEFHTPPDPSALVVVERLTGDMTTNFGAPSIALPSDTQPVASTELERWQAILQACWQAFDEAVETATGKTLAKGPRGGGRELEKIVQHVRDVDVAYLASLGGKFKSNDEREPSLAPLRQAILDTLGASARGEIPSRGPRGGLRWAPRYFVRRLAWHELDHVWEIEDRVE